MPASQAPNEIDAADPLQPTEPDLMQKPPAEPRVYTKTPMKQAEEPRVHPQDA